MVDCTRWRVFRSRVHYGDGSGDIYPIAENKQIAAREGEGEKSDKVTYNFVRRILRFSPVLSKQQ